MRPGCRCVDMAAVYPPPKCIICHMSIFFCILLFPISSFVSDHNLSMEARNYLRVVRAPAVAIFSVIVQKQCGLTIERNDVFLPYRDWCELGEQP